MRMLQTRACDTLDHGFPLNVLIHFQEGFQIDAFSMKTLSVLVRTKDLNASKCMRFQTHHISVDGA